MIRSDECAIHEQACQCLCRRRRWCAPAFEQHRLGCFFAWTQNGLARGTEGATAEALGAAQPMFLVWGPERIFLYNDAFIPFAGRKHPAAFGHR
jgi:hypothetical protein